MQNDRANDTGYPDEGRQVQQELEEQLRAFGDTVSDAFAHGFEGRGMDIGDRAYGVGRAAVRAANYGLDEAVKGIRRGRDARYKNRQEAYQKDGWAKQSFNEGAVDADTSGMPEWLRRMLGIRTETTPVDAMRAKAKERRGGGIALLSVGITFAVGFGIAAISCLAVAGAAVPLALPTAEAAYMVGSSVLSRAGMMALQICGASFTLAACGCGFVAAWGASWMSAGKKLSLLADAADGMDYKKGLPLEMLADLTHSKKAKLLKTLRRYIRKGWLSAWLDEKSAKLYLTAEDYRAAQSLVQQPEPVPPEEKAADSTPLNLETARRFAAVLEQEKRLMQDPQAREELEHMHRTTTAICDWLEAHPESMPGARRFAEYYIPTTLKLLHTYNDVQGQRGENAENIRRDIAGILHTLNQAFDNLYDKLLSDVALDVSAEITALEGMLANDGLTGGDFR